jgi:hypothetical protein
VELLYDLFFKDAVTETGVLRMRLDELAKTPGNACGEICH